MADPDPTVKNSTYAVITVIVISIMKYFLDISKKNKRNPQHNKIRPNEANNTLDTKKNSDTNLSFTESANRGKIAANAHKSHPNPNSIG